MSENAAAAGAPANATTAESGGQEATPVKPLKMSFADWKKSKEESEAPQGGSEPRNGRKPQQNFNSKKFQQHPQQCPGGGPRNQSRIGIPPMCRPPPLPLPLMSLNFRNYGPGPCGPPLPPPSMPPPRNMGMGPGPRHMNRPLQPPPFWEDMMSPQHRPPPIQPPMPKCPSLWNLVPKDKKPQPRNQQYKKQHPSNNKKSATTKAVKDAALMPPPPPPPNDNGTNSNSPGLQENGSQPSKKVKKSGGTFMQIKGKWVLKPEAPLPLNQSEPGTKEDRQRQWKEYRQAMKPFKNREFHNWKRTVQRLGKLPRDQLDEKQLERLQKAEEYIGAHKAMLTIKHAERWVPQENQTSSSTNKSQGQVYVRSPPATAWNKKSGGVGDESNSFRRGVPVKQYIGTGRAIKGAGMEPNAAPLPSGHCQSSGAAGGYFNQDATSQTFGQPSRPPPIYTGYSSHFVKSGTLLQP
ncbi:RNA-binding protein 33 [Scaptodrosophila lebanonensis]|uniref:RNA-binding protein 33 n=1 Tax=Drosophila lebanonensis TaxID=7225 RepID=A0A6J2U3S3_DROLE|nr:RNA-binding protein 33 [Scaptodrosophila lebanonensis]